MEEFTRTLNPGTVPHWQEGRAPVPVFVKVEYRGGRLSITGVEGPLRNGDAVGGCGQIVDTLARRDFTPTPGDGAFWWRNIKRLHQVWERWHLNDTRPECEHQRAAGWLEKAGQKVKLYHWRMDTHARAVQQAATEAAQESLVAGATFTLTREQAHFAAMAYEIVTTENVRPEGYEPRTPVWEGHSSVPVEEKALGWLRPDEHPEGLLCRPCPECGYKYGSEWKREEVPESVLRFLYECPEAAITPAWV